MAITVQMIEDKNFSYKIKGYDPVEVDEFLDQICDEMIAMQDEINALQQKLRSQSTPVPGAFGSVPTPSFKPQAPQKSAVPEQSEKPAPVPAPAPAPTVQHDNSEAAKKLLASAQQVYDQMVSDARREAEEIVSSARDRAESAVGDLEQEKVRIQTEIDTLKASARDYRSRFLRLIEDQTHVINAEMELFKEDE